MSAAEAQNDDLFAGPRAADLQAADATIEAAAAQVDSAAGNILVAEANLAGFQAAYERLFEGRTDDEIAILEAQVESARTNLALAELRMNQSILVAPTDGQVASIIVSEGEQAAPARAGNDPG